ncbi:MAG: peptide-methionine (S)-S-oxide reductase MsrA [Halococcoides sp.]
MEHATFGGGCFWCVEAAFEEIAGITAVVSGYAGGDEPDPTYRQVCRGTTDHAEVVQVEFDPETVTYPDLLEVFFAIHDPTQVDRQGPDVGRQYRSIVLYHDEDQREAAERYVDALEPEYSDSIATEIEPLDTFHRAEDNHQNYFEKHPADAYCRMHARPKVSTVRDRFDALVES